MRVPKTLQDSDSSLGLAQAAAGAIRRSSATLVVATRRRSQWHTKRPPVLQLPPPVLLLLFLVLDLYGALGVSPRRATAIARSWREKLGQNGIVEGCCGNGA